MPISTVDTLQNAVQSTLSTFLQHRVSTNDDLLSDVYRAIRDAATLLLEKQLVCEAFDKDPFELMNCCRHNHNLDDDHHHHHHHGRRMGTGEGVMRMEGTSNYSTHEEVSQVKITRDKKNDDMDEDLLEKKKNAEIIARAKVSEAIVQLTHYASKELSIISSSQLNPFSFERQRRILSLYQNPISH